MYSKDFTGQAVTLFALTISLSLTGSSANVVEPYNFQRFIGHWYVIATSAANGESYYKCATFDIAKEGINAAVTFTGISIPSGESETYHGEIRPAANNRAWWWVQYGETESNGSFQHVITESLGSVVIVLGNFNEQGREIHKTGIILARNNELEADELLSLKTKLYPFFNSTEIYGIKQTGC